MRSLLPAMVLTLAALPCAAEQVIFSEVMYHPAGPQPEFIEVQNLSSNPYDAAEWMISGGIRYTFPAFNAASPQAHFIKPYERLLLSAADEATTRAAWPSIPPSVRIFGPWSGSLNNAGDIILMQDAAGAKMCSLEYKDSGKWPVAADGAGHSLTVINPDREIDDWHNWQASGFSGGTPGNPEVVSAEEPFTNPDLPLGTATLVTEFNQNVTLTPNPGDTRWRYYNGTNAPQTDWATVPDASLPAQVVPDNAASPGWGPADPATQGYAPLGNETAVAPFPGIRTTVTQRANLLTYYFRTTFNWSGPATGCSFSIDHYLDDGAIYYLNGQEIGRMRMPNPAGHNNTADAAAAPEMTLELDAVVGGPDKLDGRLLAGNNVFAVELHQNSGTSSDHVCAPRLRITAPNPADIVINEIRPGAAGQGFVEFFNPSGQPIDLSGWYLTDTAANLTKFQITGPLSVPAGGFASIGFSESGLSIASPVVVTLTKPDGTTRQAGISANMPLDGRSLGRKPAGGSSWYVFYTPTRDQPNSSGNSGGSGPQLSEVHFSETGSADWVEVFNPGPGTSGTNWSISGAVPSAAGAVALPAIAAGSYVSVPVNFPTDNDGDLRLFLFDTGLNVAGAADFRQRAGLPSVQRVGSEWYNAAADTKDAPNAPVINSAVVISEIMFGTPSSHTQGQFIELYNRGDAAVDLTGWRFVDGFDYDFPAGAMLPAGEFLVVASDPAYMTANYGALSNLYGPAAGRLRGSGELVRVEDGRRNTADAVDYKVGGQWPTGTSGEGSSLELIHPDMDNSVPSAWRASDESNKTSFQTFSHTGIYRELRGQPAAITNVRELLLNLVSDGHVVMKNISLTRAASPSTKLIPNGDATSHTGNGANGFLCTGTHCLSNTLADGFHLISHGSGDTKANKAEVDVTGISPGDTLTFSFEGRWISGTPLMIAQTWDRSFGKVFRFPIPGNLGTPGRVNSRAIALPAPTVDNMKHFPVVPTSSQPVVVSARVSSVAPLTSVSLLERLDTVAGSGAWNTIAMNDGGTGGDAAAGDGIWSATVAARNDGAITQFYIAAAAQNGQNSECPRSGAERPGMWIVDNSPPSAAAGTLVQRFIISLYHRNALNSGTGYSAAYDWDHPRMSNFGWNSTIIMNEKQVFYNSELRRGGSPWTRITGNTLDRARWKTPGDNVFRNRGKSGTDNDSAGASRFHNRTVRYMMYLLGYPVPESEFIQQIVNGDAPRIGDDQEQTDSDFFNRAYENGTDGELFEIDDSWFMYDTNNMDDRLSADGVTGRWSLLDWNNSTAALPSAESPIFFHGNWPLRFPEDRYDYAGLSSFIRTAFNNNVSVAGQTVAAQESWRELMERQIDVDRAAIYAAVRGYIGDWDNFTLNRGKNGYFYRRPTDGKFEFHHWDSDLGWQNTGEAVIGSAGGMGWTNLASRPFFRRKLNYYLTELLTKYTKNSPRMNAYLTAINYQSAVSDGLAPFKTAQFSYPNWFTGREARIITEINSFGGTNYTRSFSVSTADSQTVAAPLFTLNGDGPSSVWTVEVAGHPEAVFAWSSTTGSNGLWTLSNIALAEGINTLTIRSLTRDGTVVSTLTRTVTLSGNAPPVARLVSDPPSRNVAANELIMFDATASFDPENSASPAALTYEWTVSPQTGVSATNPAPGKLQARFLTPGVYSVSVTMTDAALKTATLVREVTVFNASDFDSFGTGMLGPQFTVQNLKQRDNYSPSSWYSVEDVTGRLHIQLLDDSSKPLSSPAINYPLITRDLPDTADFVLQTSFEPDTREVGDWQSGLWLEMSEGGTNVRYAFGIEGGINLTVRRAVQPNTFTQVSTTPVTGSGATLRIKRTGSSLAFQRLVSSVWVTVSTQDAGAGATASSGGVFVSSTTATSVRMSFDYLLVADPGGSSAAVASLRISEIMYNPSGPGGVEYIEFTNIGMQPINLNGTRFDAGSPVDGLLLGNVSLAPGGYTVVTNDLAAFRAQYGAGPAVAGQWASGSLNNAGELIRLLDASGNEIHYFSYDDDPNTGWPVKPDGGGAALEIISPLTDPFAGYGTGSNWRATAETNGTPGFPPGAGPDQDGDGVPDALELIAGTDPGDASSFFRTSVAVTDGLFTLSWPSAEGRVYTVQWTSDPAQSWTTGATVPATSGTTSWTDPDSAGQPSRFYRIIVSRP